MNACEYSSKQWHPGEVDKKETDQSITNHTTNKAITHVAIAKQVANQIETTQKSEAERATAKVKWKQQMAEVMTQKPYQQLLNNRYYILEPSRDEKINSYK